MLSTGCDGNCNSYAPNFHKKLIFGLVIITLFSFGESKIVSLPFEYSSVTFLFGSFFVLC